MSKVARSVPRTAKRFSSQLTAEFGRGFSVDNLTLMRRFFLAFRDRVPTLPTVATPNLGTESPRISETPSRISSPPPFTLSWSHDAFLTGIEDPAERAFYEIEATKQYDTSLHERLALSREKDAVRSLATEGQAVTKPADLLKDPYVLEFLGLEQRPSYSESELEASIIDKLEHFLLELGKGFLFEGRQRRFTFDDEHYYVDLVFYNRLLRCFVLVDLKIGKLTHQDLGQMQMYVNH